VGTAPPAADAVAASPRAPRRAADEQADTVGEGLPLSLSQHEVWLDQRAWPGSAHLNIGGGAFLLGGLDVVRLREALALLVAEQDALRLARWPTARSACWPTWRRGWRSSRSATRPTRSKRCGPGGTRAWPSPSRWTARRPGAWRSCARTTTCTG
jgi:hypothetical protein